MYIHILGINLSFEIDTFLGSHILLFHIFLATNLQLQNKVQQFRQERHHVASTGSQRSLLVETRPFYPSKCHNSNGSHRKGNQFLDQYMCAHRNRDVAYYYQLFNWFKNRYEMKITSGFGIILRFNLIPIFNQPRASISFPEFYTISMTLQNILHQFSDRFLFACFNIKI